MGTSDETAEPQFSSQAGSKRGNFDRTPILCDAGEKNCYETQFFFYESWNICCKMKLFLLQNLKLLL